MYKIEKNIPVPGYQKYEKYPFAEMEIGDSFFRQQTEVDGDERYRIGSNIRSAARGGRWNKKFTVRWIKAENGFRCWRIE